MNAFTVTELKRPGLLSRLVGSQPRENAFIEIRNLLATKPSKELSAADVINILSTYRVAREDAMQELLAIYQQAALFAVRDKALSPEERADLKQLRYVLDLDDDGADEVEATVLRAVYRGELKRALSDQMLSDDEKRTLSLMAENLALPEAVRLRIYKEETQAVVQEAYKQAMSDRRLTEDEDQRLVAMAKNLEVEVTHDAGAQELIQRFRALARIDAGALPQVSAPIRLQRGEVCHTQYACSLSELRTVTKRINYSGTSGRIRIMKGLSWRYGSVAVKRITAEEMRRLDSGTLYITNKRLLFNGALKSVQTPLKKIIHFTLYNDGLQIEKDSGRDQFFAGQGDLEMIGTILESALRIQQQA